VIKDTDHGYRALAKQILGFKEKPIVTVGIHAAEGQKEYQKGSGDTATVLDVGTFNEFGLGVPERSFVRAWADAHKAECIEFLKSRMRLVAARKITKEQCLEQFGLFLQTSMQKNISDGGDPEFTPNAPSTIAQKGSSKPLIDTGILRSSITYKVESK
jgi:hypothetical protein